MSTADTQVNNQLAIGTESTSTEIEKQEGTRKLEAASYPSISTGSILLDSFDSRTASERATTLIGNGPVVSEELIVRCKTSVEKLPAASKVQSKQSVVKTSSHKTARELAVERMKSVLKSDRTGLRHSI